MDNKDLIKQYVDLGRFIGTYQVQLLSGTLLKSYLRKRMITIFATNDQLHLSEYIRLDDSDKKKYISLMISRDEPISNKMLSVSGDEIKSYLIDIILSNNGSLNLANYDVLNDDLKLKYLIYCVKMGFHGYSIQIMLKKSSEELRNKYYEMWIDSNKKISDETYSSLPIELQNKYDNIWNIQ